MGLWPAPGSPMPSPSCPSTTPWLRCSWPQTQVLKLWFWMEIPTHAEVWEPLA
jgi:hypothetical protein